MRPSDFQHYPWSSVEQSAEAETIALNIITILKRTGDEFRALSWEEYVQERTKDGSFSQAEKRYFDNVVEFTVSAEAASKFCLLWKGIYLALKDRA